VLVDCFWLDSVALVLLLSAKGKQASFFPLIATFFRELATAEVVLFYFLWSLPVWHRLAQDEAAGVDFGGNASNEQREIEKRKRKKTRAVVGRGASGAVAGLPIFKFLSPFLHEVALFQSSLHSPVSLFTSSPISGHPRPLLDRRRPARRPRWSQVRICHRRRVAPQVGFRCLFPQVLARLGPRRRPRQGE